MQPPKIAFGQGFVVGSVGQPTSKIVSEKNNWIKDAKKSIKRRGTEGVCTGKNMGGPSCPPGSKRYNLAKTFRKMGKKNAKS